MRASGKVYVFTISLCSHHHSQTAHLSCQTRRSFENGIEWYVFYSKQNLLDLASYNRGRDRGGSFMQKPFALWPNIDVAHATRRSSVQSRHCWICESAICAWGACAHFFAFICSTALTLFCFSRLYTTPARHVSKKYHLRKAACLELPHLLIGRNPRYLNRMYFISCREYVLLIHLFLLGDLAYLRRRCEAEGPDFEYDYQWRCQVRAFCQTNSFMVFIYFVLLLSRLRRIVTRWS